MNIARLVHPGFWFDKTPLQEALELAKRGVGGFCLYGGDTQQVADFITAVRAASPLDYLLICADYEDGLGRWLPDAPLLPSNMALGAANDEQLAFEKGLLTARQARSLGVDWVFAPVLDLADNALNPIVNTRAFSNNPTQVIKLGRAFLRGLRQGGALSSLKHFPGHGDTTTDSHLALPVLHKTSKQLLRRELIPFKALLPDADSIMLGHLLIPEIDPKFPASLSKKMLGELLRQQFRYDGCILTDALLMKAIGDEKAAALRALNAGADILLVPQHPHELIDFLEAKRPSLTILNRAIKHQETLCTRVKKSVTTDFHTAFAPNDFVRRTAQKALTLKGTRTPLRAGQTVRYLLLGADGKTSALPLLKALRRGGITVKPFKNRAQNLLIISLRRYQAFQGKIALEKEDEIRLKQALSHAQNSTAVLLASPWALPPDITITKLFTYSPAPEFQETAAEILLGKRTAKGSLPVTL